MSGRLRPEVSIEQSAPDDSQDFAPAGARAFPWGSARAGIGRGMHASLMELCAIGARRLRMRDLSRVAPMDRWGRETAQPMRCAPVRALLGTKTV